MSLQLTSKGYRQQEFFRREDRISPYHSLSGEDLRSAEEIFTHGFVWSWTPHWPNNIAYFTAYNQTARYNWMPINRLLRRLELDLKFPREPFIVIIQESHPSASSFPDSSIASLSESHMEGQRFGSHPVVIDLAKSLYGRLIGTVYDDDDFDLIQGLSQHTPYRSHD
jgi:hypothetical protein